MNKHLSLALFALITTSLATHARDLPQPSEQESELPGIISLEQAYPDTANQAHQKNEEIAHPSWASRLLRAMIDDTRSGLKKYLDKLVCHNQNTN